MHDSKERLLVQWSHEEALIEYRCLMEKAWLSLLSTAALHGLELPTNELGKCHSSLLKNIVHHTPPFSTLNVDHFRLVSLFSFMLIVNVPNLLFFRLDWRSISHDLMSKSGIQFPSSTENNALEATACNQKLQFAAVVEFKVCLSAPCSGKTQI